MPKYPLLGNGIEIHAIPEESSKDKRKYDIYVDKKLHKSIKNPEKWKLHETGRNKLSYDATEGNSTAESKYPLRGEGIEIRQQEGAKSDWRQYDIYVDPRLRVRFTREPPTEGSSETEPTTGDSSKTESTATQTTRQAHSKMKPPENKNGTETVMAGGDNDRWWKHKDGLALGYFATDKGFEPTKPITPCKD